MVTSYFIKGPKGLFLLYKTTKIICTILIKTIDFCAYPCYTINEDKERGLMKMKKEQLTQKQVKQMSNKVIRVGYCNLQSLLRGKERKGYTVGVYGWNADVYMIGEVAIVTGYRTFGDIRPDYDIVNEYEEKAKKVIGLNYDWNVIEQKLDELLKAFIKEVIA